MYLLDTNVVIWYLRKSGGITRLLSRIGQGEQLAASVATRLEVRMGMLEKERSATERLLGSLTPYDVTSDVADVAGDFIRVYRGRGITLDIVDALIAATAVVNDLVLVTLNRRHFPMPEVRLYPLFTAG